MKEKSSLDWILQEFSLAICKYDLCHFVTVLMFCEGCTKFLSVLYAKPGVSNLPPPATITSEQSSTQMATFSVLQLRENCIENCERTENGSSQYYNCSQQKCVKNLHLVTVAQAGGLFYLSSQVLVLWSITCHWFQKILLRFRERNHSKIILFVLFSVYTIIVAFFHLKSSCLSYCQLQ